MAEQIVVAYIRGDVKVPLEYKLLVEKYREYAKQRGECASWPRHEDEKMNMVYDMLVEAVQ